MSGTKIVYPVSHLQGQKNNFVKLVSLPTFVPMKKRYSPAEAWADFEKEILPTIEAPAAELRKAKQTAEGKVVKPNGTVVSLGSKRIKRLLDKYAPGVYQFHDAEPYFTKK